MTTMELTRPPDVSTRPSPVRETVTHERSAPVRVPLLTPGVKLLLALVVIGALVAAYRFFFGLQSVTNLSQSYPWGLWIAVDVATGVALAAGGFTTAALVHIFHRHHYHAIVRPALLTAMLGYTFVGIGLMADLGRYYNIWHPAVPSMWSPNSVLFEVGMCVMCYLTVLYLEFAPIVCERFMNTARPTWLRSFLTKLNGALHKVLFLLIIAGVVLSCLHQSSLGNLMVIAPTKTHPLWWTPILSLLFLLSAIAVGFPMVIFESMYASWSLKRKPEMHVLAPLSKYCAVFLAIYLGFKIGDMAIRESYVYLTPSHWSTQSTMFCIELLGGVVLPLIMFLTPSVRRSPRRLFLAALLVVLGVAVNRIDVFLVAFHPMYATTTYFPTLGEMAVTVGLISLLIFLYRVIVTHFPVISTEHEVEHA